MSEKKKITVAIAGASGFVGRNLIEQILKDDCVDVIGFCRDARGQRWEDRLTWRSCDLYSQLDAEASLRDVDVAIYLVHSMLPSAQLSQGNFQDFDLIMADNFQRAARKMGVKKIIYLSGIVPKSKRLSKHLESRLEVEDTLKASGIPVTSFRCGIIVGPNGSSFEMMLKLVRRLPVMVCPSWTESLCQPVDLANVIHYISKSVSSTQFNGKIVNLVGPEVIPYVQMLKKTGDFLNKNIPIIKSPYFSPGLSTLWVTIITGAPKNLVRPLVKSLKYDMTVENSGHVDENIIGDKTFDQSLKESFEWLEEKKYAKHERIYRPQVNSEEVRSIQRFVLPDGKNAHWVAQEYMNWLPQFLSFFVFKVENIDGHLFFKLFNIFNLLVLKFSNERSNKSRQLFYIAGGMLAKYSGRGRLEFRETWDKKYILAAIHDFRPSMPWFVYRYTQAIFHLIVMTFFGRHLWKIQQKNQK
jgi:uncharacterized protein YbjT (DUF2867 family)